MQQNLEHQFTVALAHQLEAQKIKRHLAEMGQTLLDNQTEQARLQAMLDKHQRKFGRLRSLSFAALFHAIKGSREQASDREKEAYYLKAMQIKDLQRDVELMKFEREVLLKKLEAMGDVDGIVERLRSRQSQANMSKSEKELEQLRLLRWEVHEAVLAGEAAMRQVKSMESTIEKGIYGDYWNMVLEHKVKNFDGFDKLRAQLPMAKHLVMRFDQEWRDVYTESIFAHDRSFDKLYKAFYDPKWVRSANEKELREMTWLCFEFSSKLDSRLFKLKKRLAQLDKQIEGLKMEK